MISQVNKRIYLFLFFCIIFYQASAIEKCEQLINDGVSLMENREHYESIETLMKAIKLAEENKWNRELFLAKNNIGANYSMMFDYEEALNYYLAAYEIALKHLDSDHEIIIMNNIAILYFHERNYEKAKEFFQRAYSTAKKNEIGTNSARYGINLALVLNKTNELDKGLGIIKKNIPVVENDKELNVLANLALAENYYLGGEGRVSKKILLELKQFTEGFDNKEHRLMLLNLLTRVYEDENNLKSALKYAEMAREIPSGVDNKIVVFENLSNLHKRLKNYDLALSYKDSVIISKNNWNEYLNKGIIESNKIKFDVLNYQRDIAEKQQLLIYQRKLFFSVGAVLIIFFVIIYWNLKNISIKNKQRKRITELELEQEVIKSNELESRLKKNDAIKKLEQEKLKNEIEGKNRKLSVKAIHLASRNELIEKVLQNMMKLPDISGNEVLTEQIHSLKSHLKTESHWDSFFKHFEEVNPDFLKRLNQKHPNLISTEIRFLSYVYMNLSTKEIAALLNITPKACSKRKERLLKKLNVSKELSLYSYLLAI